MGPRAELGSPKRVPWLHTQAISHQESDLNTDRISVAILEEQGGRNNTLAVVSIPFLQISYAGIVTTLAQIKSCFGWNQGATLP